MTRPAKPLRAATLQECAAYAHGAPLPPGVEIRVINGIPPKHWHDMRRRGGQFAPVSPQLWRACERLFDSFH